MRIFHKKAFDGYVATTSGVFSDPTLNEPMGTVDMIHIGGYASQVTGTNPVLSIIVEHSFDEVYWTNRYGFGALSLSTSQETLFQTNSPEPNLYAAAPYVRLKIYLGGTNPQGVFRVWVTGRDWSRRAKSKMQQVIDSADLAQHTL